MELIFAEALLSWIHDYFKDHDVTLAEVIGSLELVKADLIEEAE